MHPVIFASAGLVVIGIGSVLVFGPDFGATATPQVSPAFAADREIPAAPAGLRTVSLRVENMSCPSCPYIVQRSLESVDGVGSAKVSYQTKTARVTYDPGKAGVADLMAATARNGFPTSVIRRGDLLDDG
jgi:periplasmic mercuric ion binding protein